MAREWLSMHLLKVRVGHSTKGSHTDQDQHVVQPFYLFSNRLSAKIIIVSQRRWRREGNRRATKSRLYLPSTVRSPMLNPQTMPGTGNWNIGAGKHKIQCLRLRMTRNANDDEVIWLDSCCIHGFSFAWRWFRLQPPYLYDCGRSLCFDSTAASINDSFFCVIIETLQREWNTFILSCAMIDVCAGKIVAVIACVDVARFQSNRRPMNRP